jgi:hypothetical protein
VTVEINSAGTSPTHQNRCIFVASETNEAWHRFLISSDLFPFFPEEQGNRSGHLAPYRSCSVKPVDIFFSDGRDRQSAQR